MQLQRPAPDRLAVQRGDQEQTGWQGQLVVGGGDAQSRVEPCLEPFRELGAVGGHARAGEGVAWVEHLDADHRRGEQLFDLGHGRDQPVALPLAQRVEDRRRQLVRAPVEQPTLGQAPASQPGVAHAAVLRRLLDDDETVGLQARSSRLTYAASRSSKARSARTSRPVVPISQSSRAWPSGRSRDR